MKGMGVVRTLRESLLQAVAVRDPEGIRVDALRLAYFPIPKVASSSMKRLLALESGAAPLVEAHSFPFDTIAASRVKQLEGFTVFGVVRNPWQRLLSCYLDKIVRWGAAGRLYPGFARYNELARIRIFRRDMSFGEFVEVVGRIPDSIADEHFRSQWTFLSDRRGRIVTSDLARFESLGEGLERIGAAVGFDFTRLPHVNRTSKGSYQDVYGPRERAVVAARFRRDIELFGYEF